MEDRYLLVSSKLGDGMYGSSSTARMLIGSRKRNVFGKFAMNMILDSAL